ncbi:DUF2474 domain-containing protein [Bradyrhizobium liaoningense]|nr:DUF2474 domain-containing protein [Bradyrhizobium liaoningense]MBR1170215.1 DUF2474 domain-containing protein [Bradyrhizobium liaoningense]
MRADFPVFRRLWARRGGWLVLLWTGSVLALAIVATIFRMLLSFAGMTT